MWCRHQICASEAQRKSGVPVHQTCAAGTLWLSVAGLCCCNPALDAGTYCNATIAHREHWTAACKHASAHVQCARYTHARMCRMTSTDIAQSHNLCQSINLHFLSLGLIRGVNRQQLGNPHTLSTKCLRRSTIEHQIAGLVL